MHLNVTIVFVAAVFPQKRSCSDSDSNSDGVFYLKVDETQL